MIFEPAMACCDIIQSCFSCNIFNDRKFFGRAVDEMKINAREKNSQRDTRESTTGAGIKYSCPWLEIDYPGDAQWMKHMPFIKIVNVFPGNNIDLSVPFPV